MMADILWLVAGLVMILWGANALTDGASSLAKRLGVSDLVVGLTVVAFGTSMPEFVISLLAAIDGNAGLAVGNIVGSNIANILLILGVTALIRPLPVTRGVLLNDIPLVLLTGVILLTMGNGPLLGGGGVPMLTRVDGIILLIFCLIFLRYTFAQARSGHSVDAVGDAGNVRMPVWKMTALIAGGLVALIFGGNRFVSGASGIAQAMGVSDALIGLTIVAVGTSLPELATSVTAAVKGNAGIAIGNVIGSNILNVFFILGTSATVRPLPFGGVTNVDLLTLCASGALFWVFARFFKDKTITRAEGGVLAAGYIVYITYLVVMSL